MDIMYDTEKVRVTYNKFNLGLKYRAFCKADKLHTMVFFGTFGEAMKYAKKLENGGK